MDAMELEEQMYLQQGLLDEAAASMEAHEVSDASKSASVNPREVTSMEAQVSACADNSTTPDIPRRKSSMEAQVSDASTSTPVIPREVNMSMEAQVSTDANNSTPNIPRKIISMEAQATDAYNSTPVIPREITSMGATEEEQNEGRGASNQPVDANAVACNIQINPPMKIMVDTQGFPVEEGSTLAWQHGSNLFDDHSAGMSAEVGKDDSMAMDITDDVPCVNITGDHKDGEFLFYLLVAPCPKTMKARISHGPKSQPVKDFHKVRLPTESKPFMSDYACWRLCFPSSFSSTETEIHVTATFPKATLVNITVPVIKNLAISKPGSREVTRSKGFRRRRGMMQIEVLHKEDTSKSKGRLKLAIDSVLVLLNSRSIMGDCFAEYAHHMPWMHLGYLSSHDVENMTSKWIHWIEQEIKAPLNAEGLNIEWASKMAMASISQFNVLRHLRQGTQFHEFLGKHYEKLLSIFSEVISHLGGSLHRLLPTCATVNLEQAASELVSFTPASQWTLFLDALCKADPRFSFLEHWTAPKGGMDKQQSEIEYEDALVQVLHFAEKSSDSAFRLKAIRAAVLAAPTGSKLLKSIRNLYCRHIVSGNATEEEVERSLLTEYGRYLIRHFEGLMDVESPKGMAELLLGELRKSDRAMAIVLRILTTIFLRFQILPHSKHLKSLSEDSNPGSWDYLIQIWTCPHTFTVPLLSDEITFMYDLASKGHLEVAADAILGFVKKVDVAAEVYANAGDFVGNLRTWLQKVCARAADAAKGRNSPAAPMTPHALYRTVAKLFEKGLHSPGLLADTIDEVVQRLLRQRCGLQEVLQDARKMSVFNCTVITRQYCAFAKDALCAHLRSDGQEHDDKMLHHKAEELLQWLCMTSKDDIILDDRIQEDLCLSLLDAWNDIIENNTVVCHGTLVESRFKILLLQMVLVPASQVQSHSFYKSLLTEWTGIQEELEEGSMSVENVSKLMTHPMTSWEKICKVQKVKSQAMKAAFEDVAHYMNTLLKGFQMLLDYAIRTKGLGLTSQVIQEAQSWLEERNKDCKHFTLREIKDPDHWPLQLNDRFFKVMLILERSKLLRNIFESKAVMWISERSNLLIFGTKAGQFSATNSSNRCTGEEEDTDGEDIDIDDTDEEKDEICSISRLWRSVVNVMTISLDCYQEEWKSLSHLSYPAGRLNDLFHGIIQKDIEMEISLAQSFFGCRQEQAQWDFQSILTALTAWVNLQEKRSLLAPLLQMESMLSIVGDDSKISNTLESLCNSCTSGSLGDYLVLYENNFEVINYFSNNEGIVIKQLAESADLICFLKENSDDDLRLLTDAIEEQAEDALVDEATVSDLIHIDKVFRPLLKNTRLKMTDVKAVLELETKVSDAAAAQLSSKLGLCNTNIHRIRHFVASLADRSSVLKENMHAIMQSGIYTFAITRQFGAHSRDDVCTFSLKIGQSLAACSSKNSRQHFSLSELRDLRSRARMLLSRRRVKHDASTEESTAAPVENHVLALEEFVEHVNLAEELFDQVSTIHRSGHLLFDSFQWSGSGIRCLKDKVQWMDGQIACWNAALERARLHFNCLNFFKGIELRLIHHCLSSKAAPDQFQLCYELLEWARPGLNKGVVERYLTSCMCVTEKKSRKSCICGTEFQQCYELPDWSRPSLHKVFKAEKSLKSCVCGIEKNKMCLSSWEASETQLYACLQSLSSTIEKLFASVQLEAPCSRTGLDVSLQDKADGHQDSVLLVSVEDQNHELNVVVEVFHRNNSSLRNSSNNLLLCSSRTSWEELYLLILQYLASNGKGDDGSHVFVIAFIERLSFECQLQLLGEMQKVAKMPFWRMMKHQLALVCWTGSQALQGIAHHLNVPIQFMNGYAAQVIIQHLPGECGQMRVITSELSGMGKSTSIKAGGSSVTITVGGELSLESFILKLRSINICAQDSLHIDITTEKGYESLNCYLFELLVLGALKSSDVGVFRLITNKVCVELANTLGNRLETSVPVCSWLPQQHLVWDLNSLHVSEDLGSDEQIVCLYLDALATRQLDIKDIVTCGANINVTALPEYRCKELLFHYLIKDSSEMSYSVLTGFLKTLAYQLKKLGATDFYTVATLCWILRSPTPGSFRSTLVASLVQAAKELSLRSVKPWLHGEQQHVMKQDMSISMHERMSSLLGWSESNHVMIFFDVYGPVTVLYRDKELIPEGIKTVMSIQVQVMGTHLHDYSTLSSLELWRILSPILGQDVPTISPNYALTPDNFLKMALVSLRINTRVPVIIMGETGCGKTSLLRALATCSNANFCCLTLHAGSTEQDIESFINEAGARASSGNAQVWAFLDEINACDHLGFLNGILCHHTLHGNSLPLNLVVLAACNPYRLQDPETETVGLQSDKVNRLKNQVMAYKVQPLPEAMLDYVWDYGILSDSDERTYISAMVGTRATDIIDVLCNSQCFMRKHLGLSSVSLRDIQRWISLYDWLHADITARLKLSSRPGQKNVEGRSKILACSLCYHCRLPTKQLRKLYREMCCKFLMFKPETGRAQLPEISEAQYLGYLQEEEMDILKRMEIPHGIALNASVMENVFVVLVCILNYLPVFVVGKPGSGKTLALQIIYSNLRGADSKDTYFQQLPRILMLSYQGSQNSTSEGILKVFDKAKRYVHSNRERDILVVLVLDEIGLAETSCHNPLKVLHPLLEPNVQEIAVVGISNWSLDAAKMNRGIHLSQSDPEEEDLYKTGVAIFESYNHISSNFLRQKLHGLATAYYEYHAQQARPDFHGLRDFYYLIKSLRLCSTMLSQDQLAHSLWRNFGGGCSADVRGFFSDVARLTGCEGLASQPPPVMDLIKSNLQDPEARHLLLITKGDSASGILQHTLRQDDDFFVIQGSTYKDDKNEEYCYLMLGDIILHMEMGRRILLENADQIWSSLYDMLNQHYTVVGGRKNCRIALGVYSNPMCYVHDNFRCIVVVDHEKIPQMDPPFLNRFEKQVLTYESILDDSQKRAVESIRAWAHDLAAKSKNSGGSDSSSATWENQLFSGYFEDSVPSLVMLHWNKLETDAPNTSSQLLQRCKVDLLQTAYVDAIARAHLSGGYDLEESDHWTEMFLSWREIRCLDESIKSHISNTEDWADDIGVKLIVTTCTPLQWSIQQDMERIAASSQIKVHCMRLGDFTREKQLQAHIHKFWSDESTNMLVLQADDVLDKDHISLAKFHIDKARKAKHGERSSIKKHVLIIIHVQQGKTRSSRFSFLCGWKQLTINRLQKEPIDIRVYLERTIPEIIEHEAMPIKRIMARVLTWSYLCIKYDDKSVPASYPQEMVQLICRDELLITCLKQRALMWVLARNESLWQLAVLNNQKLLSTSASVHDAFVQYLEESFREALARLIYLIEKTSSLRSYLSYDTEKQQVWRQLMMIPDILDCDTAPAPCYPEGYSLQRPLDLHIPFSSLYAAHLDKTFKQPYLESAPNKGSLDLHSAGSRLNDGSRHVNFIQKDVDASLTPPLAIIKTSIHFDLAGYVADFSKIYLSDHLGLNHTDFQAFEWILLENLEASIHHASDVHILFWKREEEFKAQVSLALLSLSAQEIDHEVSALKAGRPPNRSFKEDLASRCCSSIMPTKTHLDEVGGIEAWLQKVKALLKLLPPVGSVDSVYLLQTMHDLALFVILPLHLNSQLLSSLAAWSIENMEQLSMSSVVTKVMASLPNLHTLSNQHECRCWIDFFCSVLKRHPHFPSFSMNHTRRALSILVTSPSPSCMMAHVMVQLLNNCCSSTADLSPEHTNIFNALISNTGEDLFSDEEWGNEANCGNSVILADQLYHNLRETILPMLMSRKEMVYADLDQCFYLALQACEDDMPISFRKITALAFIKSFLYSAASLLNQAYMSQASQNGKNHSQAVCLPVSIDILSRISSELRHAIQVLFMKILHGDFGLSADDLVNALNYCENESPFLALSCFLDSPLLRNVKNRLGFNPFTGSSNSYMTAEWALKKLVSGSKEKGNSSFKSSEVKHFFKSAGQGEQAAFVAAIASNLFVMKSGIPLANAEWSSIEWVRGTVDKLNNWDPLGKQSLRYLIAETPGGVWHLCERLPIDSLRSRCLILHILITVMNLPVRSPLRGYSMLDPAHFTGACVLTEVDNILQSVIGMDQFREYVCECGYIYIIGNCTLPNQVGICPECYKTIGGLQHALTPRNTALREDNSRRVMESSLAGKVTFAVRIQPLSYRLLRILVHYCFLIGVTTCGNTNKLASFLELPSDGQYLTRELTNRIEADMFVLDKLLACQREVTHHFIHSILQKLPEISLEGPFLTSQQRDNWELAFEKIVMRQPAHEAISEYLQSKGTDGLNDQLQERAPCPPTALQSYFRMTRVPCLSHYMTMFLQSKEKTAQFPCVTAVLDHAKHLSTLSGLLPIVEFSAALHQVMGHKITRQEAASKTIQEILQDKGHLGEKYEAFEACWNSIRPHVKGYECRQFKEPIPPMHKKQPIALCLLEKKEQGIYLAAIFELLRARQNDFLEDMKAGLLECTSASLKFFDATDARSIPSVRVQLCKAEEVVCFDEKWANHVVSELGMCNPAYGRGTQVEYDDYRIETEMQRRLIQGKVFLEGDYIEFPYQQESFQRHATLISDVVERVAQEALPTEKLSNINRELTVVRLGAGQLLGTLELCFGFLRRMNADPSELLREYCERWLGNEAHPILSKGVFDEIEVRHVVSLYEGLEAAASSAVEDMVSVSYRTDLDVGTLADLKQCVAVKKVGWSRDVGGASTASSSKGKLCAESFRDVLKRFMFRYLTTETFKPDDGLGIYLTDERLVAWPTTEDVQAARGDLDDIFPSSFQLRHSRALYLALKQMCS